MMFECHITIAPWGTQEEFEKAETIAREYGFNLSRWTMENHELTGVDLDTFLTCHSDNQGLLEGKMCNTVVALQRAGFRVRRYKIEMVLIDSRVSDEFNLFVKPSHA